MICPCCRCDYPADLLWNSPLPSGRNKYGVEYGYVCPLCRRVSLNWMIGAPLSRPSADPAAHAMYNRAIAHLEDSRQRWTLGVPVIRPLTTPHLSSPKLPAPVVIEAPAPVFFG